MSFERSDPALCQRNPACAPQEMKFVATPAAAARAWLASRMGENWVKVSELRRFARKVDADEESRSVFPFNACPRAAESDCRAPAKALVVGRGISPHRVRGLRRR